MKRIYFILMFCGFAQAGLAQENRLSLTGGYTFATGGTTLEKPTGFRVDAVYDFQSSGERWSVGGSIGYLRLTGADSVAGSKTSFSLSTVPVLLVPKFYFGEGNFKFFVKAELGTHFTSVSYEGIIAQLDNSTVGMAAGAGVGAQIWVSEKIFLGLEYDFLWLSNAFNDTGNIHSAVVGIGMKF